MTTRTRTWILLAGLSARRPDLDDVTDVVAAGHEGVRTLVERFTAVGTSKFVLIPLSEPDDWEAELTRLAAAVLDLET